MAISSPGIGSNIDVNSIVTKLMSVERAPLDRLGTKEGSYQAQLSAFGSIRSALSGFQTAVIGLASESKFSARSASSSESTVARITASAGAQTGTYNLEVAKLAQSQALAAAGQATTTDPIGAGTATQIRFEFGTITGGTLSGGTYTGATFTPSTTAATGTVSIGSTNNSLGGIKDAINAAGIGVRASIVGNGGTTPYRLMLQSTATGAATSMKITVTGDSAISSLLSNDPAGSQSLSQTAAAQDAELTINGLAITSSTNTLSEAVEGASITLSKAGSSTLVVSQDTAAIQRPIQDLVKSFNDLNGLLNKLSASDPKKGTRGELAGDGTVRGLQSQLRNALSEALGGSLSLDSLSDVGVTFQKDGSLAVDNTKLAKAIESNVAGVRALFATTSQATDSYVKVSGQTGATKAGTYALSVTTLGSQGMVAGSAPAGLTISAGVNDTLSVVLDGVSSSVKLTAGTYTAASLATMVQSVINGTSAFSSQSLGVTVTQTGGVLSIASNRYGSGSTLTIGDTGATSLLGGAATSTAGVDIAGTIGGVAATGAGRVLTAAAGGTTAGLKVEVTGGTTGSRGDITITSGFAARIDRLIDSYLDTGGLLAGRTDGLNRIVKDIGNQRDVLNRRLDDVEKRYRAQFTSLDVMMSKMLQTSSYLTQQLANLSKSS